jgi:hypothetical protein
MLARALKTLPSWQTLGLARSNCDANLTHASHLKLFTDDFFGAARGWETPWRIECSDHKVSVSSNGRDKVAGTNDDIRVPPPT